MNKAEELREEFNKKLAQLQDECPHEKKKWMDWMWAPGHFWGEVLVCLRCEKILERKEPKIVEPKRKKNIVKMA
jgi:hypothetical protein